MEIELEVKAKHILDGEPRSICNCPIALAFKEKYPEYELIATGTERLVFCEGLNWYVIAFPQFIKDWIAVFDSTGWRLVRGFQMSVEAHPAEQNVTILDVIDFPKFNPEIQ